MTLSACVAQRLKRRCSDATTPKIAPEVRDDDGADEGEATRDGKQVEDLARGCALVGAVRSLVPWGTDDEDEAEGEGNRGRGGGNEGRAGSR